MLKMTPLVVGKLEEVFSLDGTVEEACFYAGIHRSTYYEWIKIYPDLADRFEALRNKPVLAARQRAVLGVTESYYNAMDYLSRKRKGEFSNQKDVQTAMVGGGNVYNFLFSDEAREEIKALEDKIKESMIQKRHVQP